jgi:hypothetical protein
MVAAATAMPTAALCVTAAAAMPSTAARSATNTVFLLSEPDWRNHTTVPDKTQRASIEKTEARCYYNPVVAAAPVGSAPYYDTPM